MTERIRVNGEVFVAKTLAAVAASMSAGTLIRADLHLFAADVAEFHRRFPHDELAPTVRKVFHEWLAK